MQWDKDDCADLGIIKVDLLGLGMLNALEEAVPLIQTHEGKNIDYAHIPPDDPEVFDLLRRADTVGIVQVESRAQMASLPRNRPERFYDLVIQVAIIRPGPIVGGMVHPFFERRQGREPVTYLHPSLEPILKRTLGVPLFQEQLLRLAMVAAGFTGGEAEELRRAMGFKRSMDKMVTIEQKLRDGMAERGITGEAQDQIVQSITSFALYGFPESHAASFALIAYASAYLKTHHPTAFYVALLNAWPMGFYHPSTLIQDAKRRGVEVLPIDVTVSRWRCTWEATAEPDAPDAPDTPRPRRSDYLVDRRTERPRNSQPPPRAAGAVRLGLRYVKGLRREVGEDLVRERERRPFTDLDDLGLRCQIDDAQLKRLAFAGAFAGLGLRRREALWQAARVGRDAGPLFAGDRGDSGASPLPEMAPLEHTVADFQATGLTAGHHPMAYARAELRRQGVVTCAELEQLPQRRVVRFAG
ncbi:MAG: error-prone DNA polymerase, partial [Acidobacteriota bacterium]